MRSLRRKLIAVTLWSLSFTYNLSAQDKEKITDRTIQMDTAKSKVLNAVTVTATRAALQNRDGKKVFLVNQSLEAPPPTCCKMYPPCKLMQTVT